MRVNISDYMAKPDHTASVEEHQAHRQKLIHHGKRDFDQFTVIKAHEAAMYALECHRSRIQRGS